MVTNLILFILTTTDHLYPLALTLLNGIGSKKAKQLIEILGSAEAVFLEKKHLLAKLPQVNPHVLKTLNRSAALAAAEEKLNLIAKYPCSIFYYQDEQYPNRLKSQDDAPLLLYGKGNLNMNVSKIVAVVGTRNMTHYGRQICEELANGLKSINATVVSGLALGVDGEIHKNCVKNDLPTIAVLGHGLDRTYPSSHRDLADAMMDQGGLLTEFIPGTLPDRENFPMRNRIVAGMVDAVIVVESGIKGGSLITCELANDYRKEVFAFPGDVFAEYSRGCNKIIANHKAHLVTSCDEILQYMEWGAPISKQSTLNLFETLDEDQQVIIDLLKDKNDLSMDALIVLTDFSVGKINNLLLQLELMGFVLSLPAKRYKIDWQKMSA